jgi:hypothetical protein
VYNEQCRISLQAAMDFTPKNISQDGNGNGIPKLDSVSSSLLLTEIDLEKGAGVGKEKGRVL